MVSGALSAASRTAVRENSLINSASDLNDQIHFSGIHGKGYGEGNVFGYSVVRVQKGWSFGFGMGQIIKYQENLVTVKVDCYH